MAEGADAVLAKSLIDLIYEKCKNCKIVTFVTPVADTTTDTSIIETPWYMASHCNIHKTLDLPYINKVDKKFICMIRRPSWSRARLAYPLVKALQENLIISFDSRNVASQHYQNYFADIELPLTIDGVEKDQTEQHDQSDEVFWNCLFNIVVETSSQHDTNIWRSKFITEKTFKAFYMRQIPIWFAVPGLVEQVKQLGFDIFDDIVDHSYDEIQEEHDRIQFLVTQVMQLNLAYTTAECEVLRKHLSSRLEKNFQLAKDYANRISDYKYKTLNKMLSE